MWRIKRSNFTLLTSITGLAFLISTLMMPPSPGWYLWALPFLIIYQIKTDINGKLLISLFTILPIIIIFPNDQFSKIKINYSGGLRTSEHVSSAFINGADKVTVGSMPVYDKKIFLNSLTTWGYKKIVMAVDIWNDNLRINGWKYQTKINPIEHIKYFHKKGLKNIKVTDISKDGSLEGPPFKLYKKILKKFPKINLIVGGGIRSMEDIKMLKKIGVKNAIFGRAYYDGNITLDEVSNFIN